MIEDLSGETFARRLDYLFRKVKATNGRVYSVRHVAAALTEKGYPISHTRLNTLRSGQRQPRWADAVALAEFFGCPATFFLDEGGGDDDEQLARALANPEIKQVAMRLHAAQLSPEGTAAVMAMIDHVRKLEEAAEARGSGRGGGGTA